MASAPIIRSKGPLVTGIRELKQLAETFGIVRNHTDARGNAVDLIIDFSDHIYRACIEADDAKSGSVKFLEIEGENFEAVLAELWKRELLQIWFALDLGSVERKEQDVTIFESEFEDD